MPRELGPGEIAERASRKRWLSLVVVCLLLGGVSGGVVGFTTSEGDASPLAGELPAWVAALFSATWLGAMGYGAYYYETKVDELERHANYYGYAIGGGLTLLVYPVWYMFWWAGVVREPTHEALMAILLVAAVLGYLWKKYR